MNRWTDTYLDEQRQTGDLTADAVVAGLFSPQHPGHAAQVMQLLARHATHPSEYPDYVRPFLEATATLPPWADLGRMERGRRFFERYTPELMTMLGFLSLPYCYAAANGARVLTASQRLAYDAARRLQETGQFVQNVMQPGAFGPQGRGLSSARQVRLLHATVRHHLRHRPQWDGASWGLPVNQEDQAGTNLAFSLIALRGLRRMHVPIDPTDAEDYLHLWNVIGALLGVAEPMLPGTLKEAYRLDQAIARRQFRASPEGRTLTAALLKAVADQLPHATAGQLVPQYMRFLLGNDLADLLDLPPATATQKLLSPVRVWNLLRGTFAAPDAPRPALPGTGTSQPYPFQLPNRLA